MARPRLPSNVLDLRGAFKKNPQRTRHDAPGVGEFNRTPPPEMTQDTARAWHELIKRIPVAALTHTDELAVQITAQLWASWSLTRDLDTLKELRQWFAKLGMSPIDRTKLPAMPRRPDTNPFSDL